MKKQLQFIAFWAMLLISSMSWGQIPNYVPTNGLVGWWPFSGNANDLSGNNLNGNVIGATLSPDRFGNTNSAYDFDVSHWSWGSGGDEIYIPFSTLMNVSNLTVSAWFKRNTNGTSNQGMTVLNRFQYGYSNPNGQTWGMTLDQNSSLLMNTWLLQAAPNNNQTALGNIGPFIDLNIWYNVTFTFDGNKLKQYVNGILTDTDSLQGFTLNTIGNSGISIGVSNQANGHWSPFGGKIDDIGMWNRALSACEVAALYHGQPTNPPIVDLGSDTLSICGISTTLDATTIGASTYHWNTGSTSSTLVVTNSGSYSVVVTDTLGCSDSDTVYVSFLNSTITATQSTVCFGDSATLNVDTSSGSSICNVSDYPANLQSGIISYWPFCGNSNDVSTSNNNGTLQGNITYVPDRFGNPNNAIQLNNSTDIMCTSNSYNNPSNFTISIWVKSFPNSPGDFLVSFNNGQCSHGGNWDRTLYLTETQIGFYTYNGFNNYLSANGQYKDGNWHHFVVTLGTSGRKVYADGQLIIQDNTTTGQNYSGYWRLGGLSPNNVNNSSTSYFDDFIIYNRELTGTEIQQLYLFSMNSNNDVWWSDGTNNQSSIQVQPTQTTTYSVTVSDGVGTCTDSITIQVNNPQINAGADFAVCAGDSATLTATGANSYSWDNGVVNGQAFVPTVEGYYTVTGIDTLGCSNTASVYLDLLQPTSSVISITSCDTYTAPDNTVYTNSGQYTAIIPNAAGCDSTITINLTVNNTNTGIDSKTACDSYTWIDGITYTESNNTATFTLQNASGCDSVVTLNLTLNKLQNLNAGSDQSVCKGENVILTASGAETYSWNNGVADGIAFSPPLGTTTYTVTGTDGNGCTDTDEVVVTSEYCFEIPGALSPNSDNNNDTWEIKGLENYPNAQIAVFDRWGQKVYEGTSTSAPWDGKCNGKDLPTADYYYVIELGNGDNYNGVVTLKR